MEIVADLHLHSRFSRAVSSQMQVPIIAQEAKKTGVNLVGTGDWSHPIWVRELAVNLEETKPGIYQIKEAEKDSPLFLLSTEISSIYSQGGRVRRIHNLVFAPSLTTVEKINQELSLRGVKLMSDGRPTTNLSARDLTELVLTIDEQCLIIPAHAWTPWFSLYGSQSGFDSIDECFGDLAKNIFAVETGLSSDPAMNWRIEELQSRKIVSFSDAHSPQKLGREATIFELADLSYQNLRQALISNDKQNKIVKTIEFYPEEGKYHFTGHRKCGVVYSPKETRKRGVICPVCGRPLTVGVMSRVESLASIEVETKSKTDQYGVRWVKDKQEERPGYVMLVPLLEILAEAFSVGVNTKRVSAVYDQLINNFGSEFKILLQTPVEKIQNLAGEKVAQGVEKVRAGDILIEPGFDGIFGKVQIWKNQEIEAVEKVDQVSLF